MLKSGVPLASGLKSPGLKKFMFEEFMIGKSGV